MNPKTTIAMVLVAVLAGGYLYYQKPWEEPEADTEAADQTRALLEIEQDDVDRVELAMVGDRNLVFVKEGGEWSMTEPIEAPAAKHQVDTVVRQAAEIEVVKEYAADDTDRPGDSVHRLNDPIARVALHAADDTSKEVVIGARVPTGKGNYVKLAESDSIYVSKTDLSDTFLKKPERFRNRTIQKFDNNSIQRIQVEGARSFVLAKSGDTWVLESPQRGRVDKSRADQIARTVSSLSVAEFKDDDPVSLRPYGLEPARLTVTTVAEETVPPKAEPDDPDADPADTQPSVETKTYTLKIGGPVDPAGKQFFAKIDAMPWVFAVSEHTFKQVSPELSELRAKSIADIDKARVREVHVEFSDGEMTLSKAPEGTWTFEDGSTADRTAVEDMLQTLTDLEATDFVDLEDSLIDVDWDNPRARIRITRQGALEPATVLVGPSSASGRMAYVRNAADEVTATVSESEIQPLLARAVSYQDRKVMTFERARANRIELDRSEQADVVLANIEGKWQMTEPVEAEAERDAVRNVLQDLSSLQAKAIVGEVDPAEYGLDHPEVTATVHVAAMTAAPNAKVVEPVPATQPGSDIKIGEKEISELTSEEIEKHINVAKDLIQYNKDHPDEAKQEVTSMLTERLAALEEALASRQGGESEGASPSPQPAGEETEDSGRDEASESAAVRIVVSRHGGKVYALTQDASIVYELDEQIYEDLTAEFHDRRITDFDIESVEEVRLLKPDGTELAFRRSGEDWTFLPDPVVPVDNEKVTELLEVVNQIDTRRYVDYAADDVGEYGLTESSSTRIIVVLDEGEVGLAVAPIGPPADETNSRYAMLAGTQKVFLVSQETEEGLSKTLDDFLKAD